MGRSTSNSLRSSTDETIHPANNQKPTSTKPTSKRASIKHSGIQRTAKRLHIHDLHTIHPSIHQFHIRLRNNLLERTNRHVHGMKKMISTIQKKIKRKKTELEKPSKLDKYYLGTKGSVFYFIYTGAFIFAIVILYIILSQAIQEYLQPIAIDNFMDASDVTESNKFIGFWNLSLLIIIPAMILFLIVRTGQTSQYQR